MSGESTVNHQKQDLLSTTNPFASKVSTKEERWMSTFTSTNQSTTHPLLSISMYFVLYPFISIRTTCNFGRSTHQSHVNTRTSHHEYTVLVYIKLLSSIIQSKGFAITSKQTKHHLSEVWQVYSSFLEGEGLLEIDTVITSAKHSDPTSSRSRVFKSISSFTIILHTLNPQFVTAKETRTKLLLLSHLQRLQRITIYTSQEGEEHTSHNELHELNTTPAPNTQRMQRCTTTHSEVTLLPAQRALPNRDGLDAGMVLTLEHTHVGEGERRAAEGGEAREGREIEFSTALHRGVHVDLLHRVRETVLLHDMREGIGSSENELFQCGEV